MTSIAIVVLDTLRADAFEEAFDWLDGRRFANAYSTSHWTVPAHASLFTGRYASEVGVHGKSPTLDWEGTVLPEALRDAGYRTRLFTGNPQIYRYDGWDRGFDQRVNQASLGLVGDVFDWGTFGHESERSGLALYLEGLLRCLVGDCATLPSLREGYRLFTNSSAYGGAEGLRERVRATEFGDDEFLFANVMDAHTPYYPPDGGDPVVVVAADALAGSVEDPDRIRRAYRTGVEYLSKVYRDIYRELREDFDYVVTLSDHGELLGERGMWNHSIGLDPELVRVPLVVSGDDVDDGTCEAVVSLLDVHRTVADLAGLPDAVADSRGQNLLDDPEAVPRLTEYHGLVPFHDDQFERKGVADLAERYDRPLDGFVAPNGFYGYETHTEGFRSVGDPPTDDPEAQLRELVGEIDRREVDREEMSVPEDVQDRLEDLGYA
ncbi:sulfatase-like hydrolase/transferase [Halorussus salilacus]|uniref:sulfatase-like hydrolase/transferase n=1 Tax=Halorussus salilacus TaxID=2953750 RepID=UPI0020A12324|nr:sulfatase-like hydrolase/transferase [Halorussus salilacus]USZ66779.1 sulfatase-like hydrolase/transferase [Halorussus salilacus]